MIQQTSPRVLETTPAFSEPDPAPADDDFFVKAGVYMPSHLKTNKQRWGALLLVAGSGAFASGPLASWPTLEPLLIIEGVWAGPDQLNKLNSVYSIAAGVGLVSFFFSGIFYDALGARVVGSFGAFGVVVCLVGMALAVKIPQLNDLLWVVYPAAAAFGGANSFDVYAWLWLLPEHQSFVAALAGSIQCLSDSFCLVAVFLNARCGLQLHAYFLITACLSAVAGILAWVIVPPADEVQVISDACIRHTSGQTPDVETLRRSHDYGALNSQALDNSPVESVSRSHFLNSLLKSWSSVKDSYVLMTKVRPGICLLFFAFLMSTYMFCMYPMTEMYGLYVGLLGIAKATFLVNIFGGLYAFLGSAFVLVFGQIMDAIGMVQLTGYLNIILLVNACLYSVPSTYAQVGAQVLLTSVSNIWYVTVPRFCTAYAPPELFGTINGVMCLFLGIGQVFLMQFGTWASSKVSKLVHHPGVEQAVFPYLVTIDVWCFFSELSGIALLVWWWYRPLPPPGTTTRAQVRKAASGPHAAGEKNERGPELASKPLSSQHKGPSTPYSCLPTRGKHSTSTSTSTTPG